MEFTDNVKLREIEERKGSDDTFQTCVYTVSVVLVVVVVDLPFEEGV